MGRREKEALHVTLLHPRVMAFSWHVSYVNKLSGALISLILSFALTTPTEPLQRFYERTFSTRQVTWKSTMIILCISPQAIL